MISSAVSKNGVPVRLPDERWEHITANHPELAGEKAIILDIVTNPDRVLGGQQEELLAIRELVPNKWLVVAYREVGEDGFIVTAYATRRARQLDKRTQVWP